MPDGPLIDMTRETFDLMFAVNTRAPMATMQAIAPQLIHHGGGAIVNVASANAFKNESPEAPTTRPRRRSWRSPRRPRTSGDITIRANCVAPGQTITPEEEVVIADDPHEARLQHEYLRRVPLRRAGVPRDQALAVLFLASDDAARWITGQTMVVDGGELGGGDWFDPADAPAVPD